MNTLKSTSNKLCTLNILSLVLFSFLLITHQSTQAQVNKSKPKKLLNVGVEEKLGDQIPTNIEFTTSEGKIITTGQIFSGDKPVIINPVYYECPMLCSMVLNSLLDGLQKLAWSPGKQFNILTFSIDPKEGTGLAARNKNNYINNLGKKRASEGWYFLTGDSTNIKNLGDAIGFNFEYDKSKDQYAHSASIVFADPKGKITRYLYGIDFSEINLRNALYESSSGTIGSTIDKIVMYCYQYNPASRSYTPVAINIMKLGGLATLLFLGIFLGLFWLNERRKQTPKITA